MDHYPDRTLTIFPSSRAENIESTGRIERASRSRHRTLAFAAAMAIATVTAFGLNAVSGSSSNTIEIIPIVPKPEFQGPEAYRESRSRFQTSV